MPNGRPKIWRSVDTSSDKEHDVDDVDVDNERHHDVDDDDDDDDDDDASGDHEQNPFQKWIWWNCDEMNKIDMLVIIRYNWKVDDEYFVPTQNWVSVDIWIHPPAFIFWFHLAL